MTVNWKALDEQVERLSPLPELWEAALEQALGGNLRLKELLCQLERDIALSTRILVVANSEQYGKPRQISTLTGSLSYLGLDFIQNLILSSPCEEPERVSLYGQRIEFIEFWKHCLACSIFSGLLAERVLPVLQAEARTAGLLHDLGKLLMNLEEPERCARIIPERGCKALLLQEEELFGCSHAAIAQRVLESKQLPQLFVSVCGRHHSPWDELDLGQETDLLCACVALADFLTYQMELGQGGNVARAMESPIPVSRLGLSEADLENLKQEGLQRYQAALAEIRPGTIPLRRQFQLLRHASQTLGRRSLFLNKNVTELSRLQEIHEDLNRTVELEDLLRQVALRLGTIFPAEVIAFLLFLEDGPRLRFYSKLPLSERFVEQCRHSLYENFAPGRQAQMNQTEGEIQLLIPDASAGRFQLKEVRSVMSLHLQGRQGQIGKLVFFSGIPDAFSQADENLAVIIAGEIALALDRANWMRRTEILSITDELTGLFNHRRFLQILDHEFARSRRYKTPLCLLMIDIDHFKMLNDTYGHQQGDRMLRALAEILTQVTRESDMPTRYGGEEFAIVLPSTDLEGGETTAERIRRAVESTPFAYPGNPPLHMTVSIGVAFYAGELLENSRQLIEQADQALYRAKQLGRNRSVVFGKAEAHR